MICYYLDSTKAPYNHYNVQGSIAQYGACVACDQPKRFIFINIEDISTAVARIVLPFVVGYLHIAVPQQQGCTDVSTEINILRWRHGVHLWTVLICSGCMYFHMNICGNTMQSGKWKFVVVQLSVIQANQPCFLPVDEGYITLF